MPIDSQAGVICNQPNTRDRINSQNFGVNHFIILDKPERGLNVQNTGIVLQSVDLF